MGYEGRAGAGGGSWRQKMGGGVKLKERGGIRRMKDARRGRMGGEVAGCREETGGGGKGGKE